MAATDEQAAIASSPRLIKLIYSKDSGPKDWPFSVTISSPWTRAASAAAEARRKYLPVPQLSIDVLNNQGLTVEVSAGSSFATAEAIENVVLKRGEEIIRPVAINVEPATIGNAMGAKREVSQGMFRFAMDAFNPSSPLTIVCVGTRGNFELTLTAMELSQLR